MTAELGTHEVFVRGVLCAHGHLNHPDARYCCLDGIAMVQTTSRIVVGPRPQLGTLVFDDGRSYTLDRDYRIGRRPPPGDTRGRSVAALDLDDELQSISRHHLDVHLDDWAVTVVDRGSLNGTWLVRRPGAEPEPIHAEIPSALTPGTRVLVGCRSFLYESPHQGRSHAAP